MSSGKRSTSASTVSLRVSTARFQLTIRQLFEYPIRRHFNAEFADFEG
jgi:hypothetical protein